MEINKYIELLTAFEKLLYDFNLKYDWKPPILEINEDLVAPGDIDLSELLKTKMKIDGASEMALDTIDEAIEYLQTISQIFSQFKEINPEIDLNYVIHPGVIYLHFLYPNKMALIKITGGGLNQLKRMIKMY